LEITVFFWEYINLNQTFILYSHWPLIYSADVQLQVGGGPILLAICSIHSALLLLFAYVGFVESDMEFEVEALYKYAILGSGIWSLMTLVQVSIGNTPKDAK
jgi:hypothetical protein